MPKITLIVDGKKYVDDEIFDFGSVVLKKDFALYAVAPFGEIDHAGMIATFCASIEIYINKYIENKKERKYYKNLVLEYLNDNLKEKKNE